MTLTLQADRGPNLPDDAELELLTDYVGGFMSEADAQSFEERLKTDEGFFDRVGPMLDAWYQMADMLEESAPTAAIQKERLLSPAPRRQKAGRFFMIATAAASVAIAAGMAVVMVPYLRQQDTVPPTRVATAVTPSRLASAAPSATKTATTPRRVATAPTRHVAPPTSSAQAVSPESQVPLPGIEVELPGLANTPVAWPVIQNTARSVAQAPVNTSTEPGVDPLVVHDPNAPAAASTEPKSFWGRLKGRLGGLIGRHPEDLPTGKPTNAKRPPL